ncbi:MAG: TIGR00269 family protein, partial [Candidatus Bathyarchaeota archaeon]
YHIASFEEIYRITVDEIAEKIRNKPGELTPCSYCGVLRRKALNKIAKEYKATKLATAHTLDDEVQTIMLNFIHGDFTRAARIEPKLEGEVEGFIQRVKPFCEIPQEEVALYAYFNGIDFQSTECPYAPLALRSEIREFLIKLENRHPGTRYNIYRSFEKVRPMLKQSIKYELKSCEICGEPSSKNICESCRMIKKFTSDNRS